MAAFVHVRVAFLLAAALFALHLATAAGYVEIADVNKKDKKKEPKPSPLAEPAEEQTVMWCDARLYPTQRSDCGWLGITAQECSWEGCCYNALVQNVPYCFWPNTEVPQTNCDVAVADRQFCGDAGVDEASCYRENCCWSPLPDEQQGPWCYQPV